CAAHISDDGLVVINERDLQILKIGRDLLVSAVSAWSFHQEVATLNPKRRFLDDGHHSPDGEADAGRIEESDCSGAHVAGGSDATHIDGGRGTVDGDEGPVPNR